MQGLIAILLALLIIAALAVSMSKKLLPAVIIFMSYSLVMSLVWLLLESPDLAITEAAVGAGITSVLLFIALKRIKELSRDLADDEQEVEEYFEEMNQKLKDSQGGKDA
jgi:energy-converting hydrogenase B subunit D